jgi:hypothetical protein
MVCNWHRLNRCSRAVLKFARAAAAAVAAFSPTTEQYAVPGCGSVAEAAAAAAARSSMCRQDAESEVPLDLQKQLQVEEAVPPKPNQQR